MKITALKKQRAKAFLQGVETAEGYSPVAKAIWLKWGLENDYITQEVCEKHQEKLRHKLEADISSCQREISRLENSLKRPRRGL